MKKSDAGPIFLAQITATKQDGTFFKEMAPRLVSFQFGLRYWDYAAMFVLPLVLPLLFGERVWQFLQKMIKDGIEVHPFPQDRITKTHFKYQSEWNDPFKHQITMVLLMHHFNQSATLQSKIGPQKNETNRKLSPFEFALSSRNIHWRQWWIHDWPWIYLWDGLHQLMASDLREHCDRDMIGTEILLPLASHSKTTKW